MHITARKQSTLMLPFHALQTCLASLLGFGSIKSQFSEED